MGDRFWSKVEKRGEDECWEWKASINTLGYGVYWANNRNNKAHRVMWEVVRGPIPEGLIVRHKCRGKCVNPNHLELGTRSENQMDRVRDGTSNRGERHGLCKLTEDKVRQIKSATGRTITDLATEFEVSRKTIRNIRTGQRWGWLDPVTDRLPN